MLFRSTILLVEQDVMTALELASHGFVLDQGRVVLDDSSERLIHNPVVQEAYLGAVAAA